MRVASLIGCSCVGAAALFRSNAQPANTPRQEFCVPDGSVNALLVTNGIIYLGGFFTHVGPYTGGFTLLDKTTGQNDGTLPRVHGRVRAIASDGAGGWYIGGEFTKVADVAWATEATFVRIKDEASCSVAPEICVEVFSPSNTEEEISGKRDLYLRAGAKEVWLCDEFGRLGFFTAQGPIERSLLCPAFPLQVGTMGNGA